MQIIAGFVISLIVSFSGSYLVIKESMPTSPTPTDLPAPSPAQVLAESTEAPAPSITSTPSPEPTKTSTPTPSPTAIPTATSTATAAPTELPSPTPSATPSGPTTTPDVWSPGNLEPWFSQYAGQYGVDKNALERIANCESHFNPNATSPNGAYVGLFQFSAATWSNYRSQMGLDPNPDLRTNAEESIRTGAFMVSKRGTAPWPSCV